MPDARLATSPLITGVVADHAVDVRDLAWALLAVRVALGGIGNASLVIGSPKYREDAVQVEAVGSEHFGAASWNCLKA